MRFQMPQFSEWQRCFWSAVEATASPVGGEKQTTVSRALKYYYWWGGVFEGSDSQRAVRGSPRFHATLPEGP